MRQGPLKRYYLAANKKLEEIGLEEIGNDLKKGEQSITDLGDCDIILKGTAMLLLSMMKTNYAKDKTSRYVKGNMTDLANWCAGSSRIEKSKLICYLYKYKDKEKYKEEPIFQWYEGPRSNVAVIKLNEKWLKDMDWQLVKENDIDDFLDKHPGYVYWRDNGSDYLTINEKYNQTSETESGTE